MIDVTIKRQEEYRTTFFFLESFLTQLLTNLYDNITEYENDTYYERHRTKKEIQGKKEITKHYTIPLTLSEIKNHIKESNLTASLEIAFNITQNLKDSTTQLEDILQYLNKYNDYDIIKKHCFEECTFQKDNLTHSILQIKNCINQCNNFATGDLQNTNKITAHVINECNKLIEYILF